MCGQRGGVYEKRNNLKRNYFMDIPQKSPKLSTANNPKFVPKPLRIGIVGAGLMGKWHAYFANKAGGQIVAIADVNEKQASQLVEKYSSAKYFKDVLEMFSQQAIDVAHICTPTASHFEIANFAVNAKVHLLIEKPLVSTLAETLEIYDLAAKNNVKICPVHQFAFQSGVKKAQKLLSQIGQIIHLQATITSAGGAELDDNERDKIAVDIIPHPLSVTQSILNDILPADNWQIMRPIAGEIRLYGQYADTTISILVSMNARPAMNLFQITGTKGTIYIDLFHGFAYLESGKVSKTQKILRPFYVTAKNFSSATKNLMLRTLKSEFAYPGLQQLVNNFYQSIIDETEPPISSEYTINIAQIRDYLIQQTK